MIGAYERIDVAAAPEVVVEALREALRAARAHRVRGGRSRARHGGRRRSRTRGWTLVFGNPAAGAKLLELEHPDLAGAFDAVLHALAADAREAATG